MGTTLNANTAEAVRLGVKQKIIALCNTREITKQEKDRVLLWLDTQTPPLQKLEELRDKLRDSVEFRRNYKALHG